MDNLIIPIYIDTNVLLDLLASAENGFSMVEKVTTRKTSTAAESKTAASEVGTEFGIPNILNLLKIKFGGNATASSSSDDGEERTAERYHTYGSLLFRFRNYLAAKGILKQVDDTKNISWEDLQAFDFIEIRGVIQPNPLVDALERIARMLNLFALVTDIDLEKESHPSGSNRGKKKQGQTQSSETKEVQQFRLIKAFIDGILAEVAENNVRLFISSLPDLEECQAVVLLYTNYLRDSTMVEINYKEYRVLGKVVRKVEKDSDRPINLLPGTALDGMGKVALEPLRQALASIPQFELPTIQPEINGPALEIVPIAIYV